MDHNLLTFLNDLTEYTQLENTRRAECIQRTSWILHAEESEIHSLLQALQDHAPFPSRAVEEKLIETALAQLVRRYSINRTNGARNLLSDEVREAATVLYRKLSKISEARHHILTVFAHDATADDLHQFADLIASDPPQLGTHAAAPFFPLFYQKKIFVNALFPRILDGIAYLQVAAPILDLANHVKRKEMVKEHPAIERKQTLTQLLGVIVGHLGQMEQSQPTSKEFWEQVRDKVNESVTLAVALCDALALMGDSDAIGKLNQALEIGHRRVRTEAAAGLARLGEQHGIDALLELVAEPVARLRVLAYAEELGFLEKVAEKFLTQTSRAEAELVCFLAEPTHFGIPPSEIELVDERTQFWPGFDEPVQCYLFHYIYRLPSGKYSNIGIAGPAVDFLNADLTDLPSEDIYAAYAGYQTEHEEIFENSMDQLDDRQLRTTQSLQQKLVEENFQNVQPEALGIFFGENVLMATARREDIAGSVIVDSENHYWYPTRSTLRPLSAADAYLIYKGHKMLRLFNP